MSTKNVEWDDKKHSRMVECLDALPINDSEIARRIELTRGALSKIRGGQKPSRQTIKMLELICGVNPVYIINGTGEPFVSTKRDRTQLEQAMVSMVDETAPVKTSCAEVEELRKRESELQNENAYLRGQLEAYREMMLSLNQSQDDDLKKNSTAKSGAA